MNWLKNKLCAWLGIDEVNGALQLSDLGLRDLRGVSLCLTERIRRLEDIVYANQQAGVDIGINPDAISHFVLFGTYQGRDYVEVIPVQGAGFMELVKQARHLRRYERRPFRVDASAGIGREFRAAVTRP